MQFTSTVKDLLKPLAFANSAVASKATLVLSHALVCVSDGKLSATCTDLDTWAESSRAVTSVADGSCCVPARKLIEFLGSLPPTSEIEVKLLDNGKLQINCGTSKSFIAVISTEEFPALQKIKGHDVSFDADLLASMLSKVSYAQSTDYSRQVLNGVFFEFKDSALNLVAIDGRRLAKCSTESKGDGDHIIPTNLVKLLSMALKSGGEMEATFGENMVKFSGKDWAVGGKKVEGNFPNYRQVIPNPDKSLSVDRNTLIDVVKRAKIFTNEKSISVNLESQGSELKVTANTGENAFSETIECKGDTISIAFNPDYFLDQIEATTREVLELQFIDELSPLLVKEDDYTAVIMPMRQS